MPSNPMVRTPAVQQQPKVPQLVTSVLQSLQNVVVTSLWSNWVLLEVSEQEIQLQRLLRQQSLFPRPLSMSNTKLKDSCNTTPLTILCSTPCSARKGPYGQRGADSQFCANIAVDCSLTQVGRQNVPSYTDFQDQESRLQAKDHLNVPLMNLNHAKKSSRKRCEVALLPFAQDEPVPTPEA